MNATLRRPITPPVAEEPMTEDTAFVVTDAGLEALRVGQAQESTEFDAQSAPDAPEAPDVTTEAPRFCIDTREKANWYLRKLAPLEAEKALVKAQAEEILRGLDADVNRLKALHEADLQAWAKGELERMGGRKKTLPLLFGTVAFRTVPASLRVVGSAEAAEYAKSHGWEVVTTVEKLDAEGYKQQAAVVLHETGEVLPGVEIVPERESFSVKFGAKGKGGEAED